MFTQFSDLKGSKKATVVDLKDTNWTIEGTKMKLVLGLLFSIQLLAHSKIPKDYFNSLDFTKKESLIKLIKLEQRMVKRSNQILLEKNYHNSDTRYLLYTSLLMLNVFHAVDFGFVDIKTMNTFTGSTDFKTEFGKRFKVINIYLRMAQIHSKDKRIPVWQLSSNILEYGMNNPKSNLSPNLFIKAINLSKKNTFNFFNIASVIRSVKLSNAQKNKQLEVAQMLIDKKIPCGEKDKSKCGNNTKMAPFVMQNSYVILGDMFLEKANREKRSSVSHTSNNITARIIYSKARSIFSTVYKTLRWRFRNILNDRIVRANTLLLTDKVMKESFWKSKKATIMYNCATCHSL